MPARSARLFRELGRQRRVRSGSRRRLQRIRFRGHWSAEAILFFLSMLLLLTVVLPWLVQHALNADEPSAGRPAFSHSR